MEKNKNWNLEKINKERQPTRLEQGCSQPIFMGYTSVRNITVSNYKNIPNTGEGKYSFRKLCY
jgi:hypothetical protein